VIELQTSLLIFSEYSFSMRPSFFLACLLATTLAPVPSQAAPLTDQNLQAYFQDRVTELSSCCLRDIDTLDEWEAARPKLRGQLFEMLSLSPLPEKTDLRPIVTGKIEREGVVVEKIHFQSMPQLYVTADLYLPAKIDKPLPAILYVCGHGPVKTNGVSYGNKVAYQHHGAWFARNGYACLIVDTIQLGEIEGLHHGTYREAMWWWNSRGYTPAGVEAWNGIRALDYLETRPEIDKTRFGVTGRSGGGAYSWWVTALDDRVKVSAPVAGITDLQNYVVDGVVEGHCDCMFFVNTYGWDYPLVAALAAPRPLMIGNSDRDTIFPLDGVERLHKKVSKIYALYKKPENLALVITAGPHKDTQELQVPVFRWFNHHLKNDDSPIDLVAKPLFTGQELKVFPENISGLPADERTSKIHDTFVATADVRLPKSASEWQTVRATLLDHLKQQVFAGWPAHECEMNPTLTANGKMTNATLITFSSEEHVPLKMVLFRPEQPGAKELRLHIMQESDYPAAVGIAGATTHHANYTAVLFTRGDGPRMEDAKTEVQIRRRYMLAGQTVDSMRVWDIGRALQLLHQNRETASLHITATASGDDAVNLIYASLFDDGPAEFALNLELTHLPASQSSGPDYLNVLRFLDLPQALALCLENHQMKMIDCPASVSDWANNLAAELHWRNKIN
jgi:dienelactone hydrolase